MTVKELERREWERLTDRLSDLTLEAGLLKDPKLNERFTSLAEAIKSLVERHAALDAMLHEVARAEGAREALMGIIKEQRANEMYLLEQLRAARSAASKEA